MIADSGPTEELNVEIVHNSTIEPLTETEIASCNNESSEENEDLIIVQNGTRKIVNKTVYHKLHKLPENSESRLSENSLKKYEKFSTENKKIPVPKPRIKRENSIGNEEIEYVSCVIRSESVDTIDKIEQELSNFVMDNKKKEKKRTNSFRKLFSVPFFGKDKKRKEKDKINQPSPNSDNYQNETNSFVRNTPQRHTLSCDHYKTKNTQRVVQNIDEDPPPELMRRYANNHINRFNKIRQSFEKPKDTVDSNEWKNQANSSITKYIDTSSSSSTLESKNTYQNALVAQAEIQNVKQQQIRRNDSLKRDTPPRAQDTNQTVNIVKPKARLPINSNRPLPNPYQSNVDEENSNPKLNEIYGTVFDAVDRKPRDSHNFQTIQNSKIPSPIGRPLRSPSLENSKLKLPPNREILTSQPRKLRSPLPAPKISPEKIIATELLRNNNNNTASPLQKIQNSELEIDEMKNKLKNLTIEHENETNSPRSTLRTSSRSTVTMSPLPHVLPTSDTPSYPSPDVELRQKMGMMNKIGPPSPSKDEIRRSVEAYYWKEIKKIKEQEDYEIYMSQLQFSHAGYAEDPIQSNRRSRGGYYDNGRNKRSSSVPRNVRQQLSFDDPKLMIPERQSIVYNAQGVYGYLPPKRYTTMQNKPDGTYKPIFRRGSLSTPIQPIQSNKKVSFSNNKSENFESWPTKNGFTKSPPQRRLERAVNTQFEDPTNHHQPVYVHQWEFQQHHQPNIYTTSDIRNSIYDYNVAAQVQLRKPTNYNSDSETVYGNQRVYKTMSRQEMENLRNSQSKPVVFRKPIPTLTRHESIQLPEPMYYGYGRTNNNNNSLYGSNSNNNRHYIPNPRIPQTPPGEAVLMTENVYNYGYNESPYGYGYGYSNSESPYGTKTRQITVRNKVCDIYGNIHDVGQVQATGVLMGQLQNSPSSPTSSNSNFVRGTRLTSSNNDVLLLRRKQANINDPIYEIRGAPVRPLPPLPPSRKNNDKTNIPKKKKK